MLALERRNEIKTILLEKQSLTVSELAKHYNVSFETIRRDFDVLQHEGFLTKTYGGALLRKHVQADVKYNVLVNLFLESKQRIAEQAAKFIYPGECIFIDHSTTAYQLVNIIKEWRLTVMTNSIKVLSELSDYPDISLVAAGGKYDHNLYSFMGSTAEKTVQNFHMDKAFISCRAIDMRKGLSDKYENEADMRKTIIDNADSVYLLMDHTKFDKVTFVHTCDPNKISAVITDHILSDRWKEYLESKEIKYYENADSVK